MNELVLAHHFAHPLAEVFQACTEPEQARRWWGAPPGYRRVGTTGTLAPGAKFRMDIRGATGERVVLIGQLREVTQDRSLTVATRWSGGPLDGRTTTVVLTFAAEGAGTRLDLRHGPFDEDRLLEGHRAYWQHAFGRLARVLAGETLPCFEELLEESRAFQDPLGVAAYAVLAGLRAAGAPAETIAQVEATLYTHLAALSAEPYGMLADVLRARLSPEV